MIGLCIWRKAKWCRICESAWEQILWLENRGMHFSRDHRGRLSKRTFGGHTRNFGELAAKVAAVREKLMASLTASFESERDRAAARVREAVSPYAAFVRRERERLVEARTRLERLGADLEGLTTRVDALHG